MKTQQLIVRCVLAVMPWVGNPMVAAAQPADLHDLAVEGRWKNVLEVALRRTEQLPLSPDEAVIAAHAARVLGDRMAEERFLSIALAGSGADLASLAAVQLAAVVGPADPARAVDLALPRFDRGHAFRVREAASEVVTAVVASGRDGPSRAVIESSVARLPREVERRLELALAQTDEDNRRQRLQRLLEVSTRDLVALEAAESLLELDPLPASARWRVATTLFDHALYDRAAPLFEGLQDVRDSAVPRDDAAFLRGRCAFRRGRWSEAIDWYTKALALSRTNGRRAELEVHIGRSHELAGDLDKAVDAAVRAVRFDTTDDRRLFLARLRLRRGETELAAQGLARLRSRTARSQGEVMLGLAAIRRGDASSARAHLAKARRAPWSAPATVFEAELMLAAGDAGAALEILDRSWRVLGPFWDEHARAVMARLPKEDVEAWRSERRQAAAAADGHSPWRELARWATLEPDAAHLVEIGRRVETSFERAFQGTRPPFPAGLSADLWRLGLERESATWDPGGFPRDGAGESAWSAQRFLDFDLPWLALRAADEGWRQAGSEMPARVLPTELRRTLFPLPNPAMVRRAAASGSVDWSLLAAVAREESRWDPRAMSAVGARGLVQLMPGTAESVSARIGAVRPTVEDLFDPQINLTLGGAELGRLLAVFEGRRAPAVAAYNAGEVQARVWLEQCGAGCSDALYVANISFAATRSYTAAVLAAADCYAALHGAKGGTPSPGEPLTD